MVFGGIQESTTTFFGFCQPFIATAGNMKGIRFFCFNYSRKHLHVFRQFTGIASRHAGCRDQKVFY